MTLKTFYSLRIFFRLLRMILALFALVDGAIVAIGLYKLEFGRELLIYATWTALWALLVVLLTEVMEIVSEKIDRLKTEG
ncbi:MAG: hypothetical protein WAV31_05825 [Candidatus Moraniibacteriota bacterium]